MGVSGITEQSARRGRVEVRAEILYDLRSQIRKAVRMTEMHYFDPTAWRLVPGRTVHVVIDDQNDFLHPDGWYAHARHRHLAHAAGDRADEGAHR